MECVCPECVYAGIKMEGVGDGNLSGGSAGEIVEQFVDTEC
jgi:hypothetical protein